MRKMTETRLLCKLASYCTTIDMELISKGRVRAQCAHCGGIFEQYLSVANRRKEITCSLSCARSHTPSKKRKRVNLSCKACESSFEVAWARRNKAKFCSVPCKNLIQRGLNHHGYKDGRSKERGQHRKVIFQRVKDEGACQECGSTHKLHGHHIKSYSEYPELRSDPLNIQVLCEECHASKHPAMARKLFNGTPRSGQTKQCPSCKTKFYVKLSHVSKRLCCSRSCSYQVRSLGLRLNTHGPT